MSQTIERMNGQERLQHMLMFLSFTVLAITGFLVFLPEQYVSYLGTSSETFFQWRGYVHRIAGLVMIAVSVIHVGYLLLTPRGRWQFRELLPRKKDWDDLQQMIRYFRDPHQSPPQFGWYNYVEKAEYWSLVWGVIMMGATGFALWAEWAFPKLVLDIATVVHRYEAILAVASIFIWHFYHVHWKPEVFPMNPVWLTGTITEEQLRHHHPLAYESVMRRIQKESDES